MYRKWYWIRYSYKFKESWFRKKYKVQYDAEINAFVVYGKEWWSRHWYNEMSFTDQFGDEFSRFFKDTESAYDFIETLKSLDREI
jgi:hypothetical protein